MLGPSRHLNRDLAPLLFLAALSVGFLWRCNLTGKAMLPADLLLVMEPWRHYSHQFPEFERVSNPILDAVQQFYPWRKFAGQHLRQGEIPLWNPHELSGNPFVGNNQSAVFYPETWLHALMPTERALGWATSLYFFISGALMYWFLRVLRLRRAACLIGAVAFMFNGFVVGWLCFPSFRSVPGWLPGMLAGFELFSRTRRVGWLAPCALCAGMQFLAGNLHISLYLLIVFVAYVVFRCAALWAEGSRRGALSAGVAAGVVLVLGALLAAAQLMPALELAGMSSRSGGLSYSGLLSHGIAWQGLLTALMPDIFGNPVDYNHWGAHLGKVYRAYTETAFYVGVAPLLLLPAAFAGTRRQATFWLGVAGVGALLALGTHLNALVYYLVPGFKSLSGIGRAVLMISVGLSICGALGAHNLLEMATRNREAIGRYVLRSGAALALIGVVGGLWTWAVTGQFEALAPGIGAYTLAQIARFALLLLVAMAGAGLIIKSPKFGAVILLTCLAMDLYIFVDRFTPSVNPMYLQIRPRAIEIVKSAPGHPRVLTLGENAIKRMSPNTAMIVGLEDIQGSDSLEIGAYRKLLNECGSNELGFPQPNPALPVIDLLGVRFVHSGVPLEGVEKLKLISDFDGYLYENTRALPRAFTVPKSRQAGAAGALREVVSPEFEPEREALISGGVQPSSRAESRPTSGVTIAEHEPNSVLLSGQFQPGQLVVLADAYYPGWRAYEGSKELPIMRADYVLRAVQTTSQGKQIRFLYVPGSFWVGGFATLLGLGILAALASAAWVHGRPQN